MVTATGEAVAGFWAQNGVDIGTIEYKPETEPIVCAGQTVPDDALFCHKKRHGGGDMKFETQAMTQLRTETGDLGVEIIVAHELGHAVQYASGRSGEGTIWELSADCFAGAYLTSAGVSPSAANEAITHTQLVTGVAVQAGADAPTAAMDYGMTSRERGGELIQQCLTYHP